MRILKFYSKKAINYRKAINNATKTNIFEAYKRPSSAKIRAFYNIKESFDTRVKLLETEFNCCVVYKKIAILSHNVFSFVVGYNITYVSGDYDTVEEYKIFTCDNIYSCTTTL